MQSPSNHRLAFFVSKDNQLSDVVAAFDGPLGQGLKTYQRPDNWRLNYDWVIKPNLLFHATYGYSRTRQLWDNPQQKGAASAFGFPGITGDSDAMPRVQFTGADAYTPWGVQDGKVRNGSQLNVTKHFTASINWVHGKHEIKTGMDIRLPSTFSNPIDLAGTQRAILLRASPDRSADEPVRHGQCFREHVVGTPWIRRTVWPRRWFPAISVINITQATFRTTGGSRRG